MFYTQHCDHVEPAQALHARMQPLLLFFIDAANLIDSDEPEWDLLLAVHTKGDAITVVNPWLSCSPPMHRNRHHQYPSRH